MPGLSVAGLETYWSRTLSGVFLFCAYLPESVCIHYLQSRLKT